MELSFSPNHYVFTQFLSRPGPRAPRGFVIHVAFLVHPRWRKLSPTRPNVTVPVLFGLNAARGSITLSERIELFEKSSPRMSGNLSSCIFDMLTDATAISKRELKKPSLKDLIPAGHFFSLSERLEELKKIHHNPYSLLFIWGKPCSNVENLRQARPMHGLPQFSTACNEFFSSLPGHACS